MSCALLTLRTQLPSFLLQTPLETVNVIYILEGLLNRRQQDHSHLLFQLIEQLNLSIGLQQFQVHQHNYQPIQENHYFI